MNLSFVSFQGVHSDYRSWGMVRIIEPISDKIKTPHRYYVSHAPKKYKCFLEVSTLHKIFSRLVWTIGTRIKLNVGLLRYLQEISFDFFLSKKINYPCVLVSTALIPTAARKNYSAGGLNIFIAGNPYDGWINSILEKEKTSNHVKISNAYTFKPRLKFIDSFLSAQNEIISQTVVTHESLQNKFAKARKKLIPYELIPEKNLFSDIKIQKRKPVTFIYLASTVWLKGLTYLIDAWRSLGETDARLVVAGPIYPDVWNAIKDNLPNSIEFIGFIPASNINALYRSCHVCIVPSLADDHPATIAEAMYCKLPVIATHECGSRELITDGETGFVIPSANTRVLAEKISWFMKNSFLIEDMGNKAKTSIEAIDKNEQENNMVKYIKQVAIKFEN